MSTTDAFNPISRIMVAVDESPNATRALDVAGRMAQALKARLCVVHGVDIRAAILPEVGIASEQILDGLRGAGRSIVNDARDRLQMVAPGVEAEFTCVEGVVPDEIIAQARSWQADLLVVGTHGRRGLSRLLMGSTAEHIIRHAGTPVLVVPMPPAEAAA